MKGVLGVLALLVALGCGDRPGSGGLAGRLGGRKTPPDVAPVMLNEESPFRYPPALWAQRIQGNVTLRVLVDSLGLPIPDSTTIATSSGIASLDSAALEGAASLRFRPALSHNAPVGVALLLPVFFRHPAAPPLPGDSAIKRDNKTPDQQ
jgi:TonB family protein